MLFLLEEGFVPEGLEGMGLWGCCWIPQFYLGRGKLGMASPLVGNFGTLDMDFWGGGLYQEPREGGC